MRIIQAIFFLFLLTSCGSNTVQNQLHPMVDGSKSEWELVDKEAIPISDDVTLFIFQNDSYVWIAYDFPKESFATLDMVIETEKVRTPLNLHVSAQLGEWPLGQEESIPKSPTSDLWWNNSGWTANNLWVNGIDTLTYSTPELKIKKSEIREIQLSKDRFGRGEWKIKLKINAIKTKNGNFTNLQFPEDETYHMIDAT